jgi:hypothetical protein
MTLILEMTLIFIYLMELFVFKVSETFNVQLIFALKLEYSMANNNMLFINFYLTNVMSLILYYIIKWVSIINFIILFIQIFFK